MILKSIELQDFMCYAGPTKFEFAEGINLIIGDNGYGKSKLFDAFYWVMYDQCFDTGLKKFMDTRFMKRQIVSDKAIYEAEEGTITASVTLTFVNERKQEFDLTRRYVVRKRDDEIIGDAESNLVIRQRDLGLGTGKVLNDPEDIERVKANVLPNNVKPYMWFQGEQVESIIDFNKHDTLTQAINVLSNIRQYDGITELADGLKESVERDYQKKLRELSKDKARSEDLELQRAAAVEKIEAEQLLELKIKDNLANAQERSENLLQRSATAEQIRLHESKRVHLETSLREASETLSEENVAFHKRLFADRWVLKGTEGLFEAFAKKYSAYEATKLSKMAELKARRALDSEIVQTRLPIDVPEPIYVQQMLDKERCLVCDRQAEEGSEPWMKIKELLDRSRAAIKALQVEEERAHDFSPDLKRLYANGQALSHVVKDIDENIAQTRLRIKKHQERVKDLGRELEKLRMTVDGLVADNALGVDAAKNLLSEYASQRDMMQRFEREGMDIGHSIAQRREQLEGINKQLKELVTSEIPKYLNEKVSVLTDLHTIAHSTRQRVFKQLVTTLEQEANRHYLDMTKDNLSTRGIIHLKELANGNYMPELVDEQGNILLNLNTGNIILIKLAAIMAIITARQGMRTTDLYTLITDAPMSVFGEDYTIGFCKTVSKVYRQSIIMSKEFYKNLALRDQLLGDKEIRLGRVYVITPSIPEAARTNRNSLSTVVTRLN